MTNEERETTVNYDDTSSPAKVGTYNAALLRKMERLAAEHPDEVSVLRREGEFWLFCRAEKMDKDKPAAQGF